MNLLLQELQGNEPIDLMSSNAKQSCRAFFLAGPTAVGKTSVAHHLALQHGLTVLSADSMLVYRGMDIGTAKPLPGELEEVQYLGIDLVEPDRLFSVADYCNYVSEAVKGIDNDIIVTGGTGLYVKALLHGLADGPPPATDLRERLIKLYEQDGLAVLQEEVKSRSVTLFDSIEDKSNPRRLIRAVERYEAGIEVQPDSWTGGVEPVCTGLRMDPPLLRESIMQRVIKMYDNGLLDEVTSLLKRYDLSRTARQAIGYGEAIDCLAGTISRDAAIELTAKRTRALAKRQGTWFRNQEKMDWIDVNPGMPIETVCEQVFNSFSRNGAWPLHPD